MQLIIDGAYKHIKTGGSYWVLAIASPVETPPTLSSYSVMHSETEEIFEVYGVREDAVFVGDLDSPKRVIIKRLEESPQKLLLAVGAGHMRCSAMAGLKQLRLAIIHLFRKVNRQVVLRDWLSGNLRSQLSAIIWLKVTTLVAIAELSKCFLTRPIETTRNKA